MKKAIVANTKRKRKNAKGQGRKPEPGYHATIKVRFESADDLTYVLEHMPDLLERGRVLRHTASDNSLLKSLLADEGEA